MDYLDIAYELKNLILNDERYLLLRQLEAKLTNNEEVQKLAKIKEEKKIILDKTLEMYSKESKESRSALMDFFHASDDLSSHPVVKEYSEQYEKLSSLIDEINDILFKEFIGKKTCA